MIIVVSAASVELTEPDDFRRFHVTAPAGVDVAAALGAAAAGRAADGDDVFVDIAWLRSEAARLGVGEAWPEGFAAMLDYAGSKGWLDDGGAAVRAHVEGT